MECINKGFREIKSKSTTSESIHSHQKDFDRFTENHSDVNNQDIGHIFSRDDLIETYLESVTLQNNCLALLRKHKALVRHDHGKLVDHVKILSGGAASNDPLYSGSIGMGMLTGAIFGDLKKCPPSLIILEVLRFMSRGNKQGILVIVLNNLANRLNFGLACQSAAQEGIKTLLVNVGEDVSGVSISKTIGRRGLCGIKFLYKIAGAMSEEKRTLYEIYHVIQTLKGNSLGTINVGIRPDAMVIGPGCKGDSEKLCFLWNTFDDMGKTERLAFIVRQAMSHLFHPSSYFSLHVVKGNEIVVIINNLGKLSDFNLNLITKEVLEQMNILGYKVMRVYCGRFFNSNLAGFSLSVLKVKGNILELLDRPVNVISWPERPSTVTTKPNLIWDELTTPYKSTLGDRSSIGPKFTRRDASYLLDVLPIVIESIENMEEYLNKLDNDHDFGTAMNKFGNAIKTEIQKRSLNISTPYEFLEQMAYLAGMTMGGVSGGIFSILFSSAAQVFLGASPKSSPNIGMWVNAARAARDGLQRFTRVQPGDGTILDALNPFVESLTDHSVKGLSKRVSAAMRGAEDTSTRSTRGSRVKRPSTLKTRKEEWAMGEGARKETNVEEVVRAPDPGALCLASVIRTIFTSLQIDLAETEAEAEAVLLRDTTKKGVAQEHIEKDPKNVQELEEKDSRQEKQKEEHQKINESSQMLKESHSEEMKQLKEVFDDIANEIEDEVPEEHN